MPLGRVKGQSHVVRQFEEKLRSGKLAHAYLFHGPDGVGKKLFAMELAKVLLCRKVSVARPGTGIDSSAFEWGCDACPSCRKVARGEHENLILIQVADERQKILIEQVREMARVLHLKAIDESYRICVIDCAEKMSAEAANALLKTLEEPPPWSLIVLISSLPEFLLETIRSRCQAVKFHPLSEEIVYDLLGGEAVPEGVEIQTVAKLSQGSIGLARRYVREGILRRRREFVEAVLGSSGNTEVWEFVAEWQKGGSSTENVRERVREMLDHLLLILRDSLVIASGVGSGKIRNTDMTEFVEQVAQRSPNWLNRAIDIVQVAREHIDKNANPKIVVEWLALKLCGGDFHPMRIRQGSNQGSAF